MYARHAFTPEGKVVTAVALLKLFGYADVRLASKPLFHLVGLHQLVDFHVQRGPRGAGDTGASFSPAVLSVLFSTHYDAGDAAVSKESADSL